MNRIVTFLFLILFKFTAYSQTYKTEPFSSEIHTLQVNVNGDWLRSSILDLRSDDFILINFDRISENSFNQLRYKVIHCNADWTPSQLTEFEYLDGFNDNRIDDYSPSINTTVEYTNFQLAIPNKDITLRLSGNYVVLVYEDINPRNILLSACFSILDNQLTISGNVTSNTLIDANKSHQQVSFNINHQGINIRDPFNDLKIYVRQNNRLDNEKRLVKPTFIQPFLLNYEKNRDLIFEAGNEYRRFEIVSNRFNGLRVQSVWYDRPFYYATILSDKIRANKRYVLDMDQNGRFMIRNAEARIDDVESDYFFVKLTLESDNPFLEKVYVNGEFTNNAFTEKYQMQYDFDKKEYFSILKLKQGAYNYHYLIDKGGFFSTSGMEGNYFETENEYQILAYFRPVGERYDRLIGLLNLRQNNGR